MPLRLIKKKDSPYWYVRGTYAKGASIYESTRIPHGGRVRPQQEAKEYLEQIEKELGRSKKYTVLDAVKVYLSRGGSPRFIDKLIETMGHVQLSHIDQQMLDLKAREAYPSVTVASLNRQFYTPFIAVWNAASVGQNAMCSFVKWARPKGSSKLTQVRRAVSYEDAIKFINALPPHAARVMLFLFYTGARPIEAFTLQSCDVDTKNKWAVLHDTKTVPRGIPLHESILPIFIEQQGFAFRNSQGNNFPDTRRYNKAGRILSQGGGQLKKDIAIAKEATGLDITPYIARHTVATHLDAIIPSAQKDAILGHSKGISGHYVTTPQEELVKSINKLPCPITLGLQIEKIVCRISADKNKEKTENVIA